MLQNGASSAPPLRSQLPRERWDLYRTLAEPLRLRLLALVAEEELAVGELAELLKESQPNVSRAWTPLRDAGLVVARREGTRVFLRVREEASKTRSCSMRSQAAARSPRKTEASRVFRRSSPRATWRARAYFDAPRARDPESLKAPPAELAAYLFAVSPYRDQVALDAGTGDGGLLDVLAPAFSRE